MMRLVFLFAAPLMISGCMTAQTGSADRPEARAVLSSADGQARGSASLSEGPSGLMLRVEAQGLLPGSHGIHIHTVGRCEPPDFQSAGAHWNPSGRQHGRDNPQGAHHGDLPNISIDANGRGTLHAQMAGRGLTELLDSDGASIVIHASPDDYRTDPSGNSGSRTACGVIQRD